MASEILLNQNLTPEMRKTLFEDAELDMLWHCQADPRFPYYARLPANTYDPDRGVLRTAVLVHGTGGHAQHYLEAFRAFADRNGIALIAPLFPGGLIEREDFSSYKMLSCQGVRYDLVLLAMLDELGRRFERLDTGRVFMFGHSGGGQFTHRFLYAHPERLAAAAVGAPGRITYLDDGHDYFWGTRDFEDYFDKRPDIGKIRQVPVQLLIGEHDTKDIGPSPFGSSRMERLLNLKKNYEDKGIDVRIKIVPGAGHSDGYRERSLAAMDFFEKVLAGTAQ